VKNVGALRVYQRDRHKGKRKKDILDPTGKGVQTEAGNCAHITYQSLRGLATDEGGRKSHCNQEAREEFRALDNEVLSIATAKPKS